MDQDGRSEVGGRGRGTPLGEPGPALRRRVSPAAAVNPDSCALFRLGEACDHACPMCTNTGRPTLRLHDTAELLRRAAFLASLGFRRVVLTGGEPTRHPGWTTLLEALFGSGVAFGVNSHGRAFRSPTFARHAREHGLDRAILSLHSHDPAVAAVMSGTRVEAHAETCAGARALVADGVDVTLNLVISRLNANGLSRFVELCAAECPGAAAKLCFPSLTLEQGRWGEVELPYAEVLGEVLKAGRAAERLGVRFYLEGFPSCLVGTPSRVDLGRSAWGETHYLDDASGDRIYAMAWCEAQSREYAARCAGCGASAACPGLANGYLARFGESELRPFPNLARSFGA